MRPPTGSTQAIISSMLSGESFDHGLQLLQQRPRAAIRHLLKVLEGKTLDLNLAESGSQQRETADLAHLALDSLGASHPEVLIAFLERSLISGTATSCFALTWALAHSGTMKGLSTSAKALEHQDRFVRWAGCTDLARRGGDTVRSLLHRAANDRASAVRSVAVEALTRVGDETSLPILEKRLRDRYPGIREAAGKAIAAIKKQRTEL